MTAECARARSERRVTDGHDQPISRVTSIDVARAAGVSQSTVSLVFSGKGAGRVSSATSDAVRAAAQELGYRPNAAARSLKTGSAGAVCLAVPEVTNPFFGRVLRGASRSAAAAGYVVALVDAARNIDTWDHEAVQALRGAGTVDGFLLFSGTPPSREANLGEPIVLVEAEGRGFSSVRLDGRGGTAAAVEHLLALGHRRIGHVAGDYADKQNFRRRDEGRRDAMRAAGLDPEEQPVARTREFSFGPARDAGYALLDRPDRPTGVVCDDDILAGGLLMAARELGLRVPEDLSVVGFDDLDFAQGLEPALTTMRADADLLGATAFELLAERMVDPGRPIRRVVQPVTLVERRSTAPPA